jgi:hypothetical protein
LHIQLKGAPSLALACSAAGEPTTGKNKNREKQKKVLTRFLAFPLETPFHIQTPFSS